MSVVCAACEHVNKDGRKFCGGCGAPLVSGCPSCGAENDPGERFCGECGSPLAVTPASPAPPPPAPPPRSEPARPRPAASPTARQVRDARRLEGERKQITVLFADVKGSMELQGGMDPEVWADIMDRLFRLLSDSVQRFEGTIDKFTGDGIMALFGAPIALEDHAARACHAALHIKEAVVSYAEELQRKNGIELRLRIGLNSGEVVVGRIGDDLSMQYTAVGPTVGLAQRMESLAEPGTAYITDNTARLVGDIYRLRDLGPMEAKGVVEPVGVHVLEGTAPSAGRSSRSRLGRRSELIGRQDATAALRSALARARQGHAQVVGIVGEAGVGNSRLCEEFAAYCQREEINVRRAAGMSHTRDVPMLPIISYLRDLFSISDVDTPAQSRDRVAQRLLFLDPALEDVFPLLFDVLGIPDPDRPAPRLGPEARIRRLLEVWRRIARSRSGKEVLVLMLEDLHWFDAQSAAFLEQLIPTYPGTRTLVVTNFRPEFRARWMEYSYYQQISLQPLDAEGVGQLVSGLLGSDPSLGTLADHVLTRTGGNPFFVEEVLRTMVEDGTLEGEPGVYRLTRPLVEIKVPPTVQAVLAARIDRVSEEEKLILRTAAVIGRTFAEPILRRVAGSDEDMTARTLQELCAAELLQEEQMYPTAEYSFWHVLTQEVAYASMLAERRARLHAAVAEALIDYRPDRLDEEAAIIAWHWERARKPLEAALWSIRAGNWSLRSDLDQALKRWRAAVEFLAPVDESPVSLELGTRARIRLIQFGGRRGMPPDELDRLEMEGRALAERTGKLGLRGITVAVCGAARGWAGDLRGMADRHLEAARLADSGDDIELQAAAYWINAVGPTYMGPMGEGLAWVERGLAVCDGDLERGMTLLGYSSMTFALVFRGALLMWMGRLPEAPADLQRAISLARQRSETEALAWGLARLSWLAWLAGDPEPAAVAASEAVRIGEDTANIGCLVLGLEAVAIARLMSGDGGGAEDACLRAVAEGRKNRSGLFAEASVLTHLARARLATGDLEGAAAACEESLAVARRREARVSECLALLVRAQIRRCRGAATGEIVADLAAALEMAVATDAAIYEPFIREEIGRATGDEGELQAAARIFDSMGAAGHARRLRDELGGKNAEAPNLAT